MNDVASHRVPTSADGADQVFAECDLDVLKALVTDLEADHSVTILNPPSVCLTMIPAEDSLDKQKFYLGEALTTECEVLVNEKPGFGLCLGDQPVRAYCMAVLDAILHGGGAIPATIDHFLQQQGAILKRKRQDEADLILQTQVDFKLMEEA
jgi:alpha-D-ribose 1-methylphosphonate 5-triphosphate synthase subunit PhnG